MPASALQGYTNQAALAKRTKWLLEARDPQLPPTTTSRIWWLRSGRGTGKSRSALEWLVDMCRRYPGLRAHVVAATASDLRVTVFEGESGLLEIIDPSELKQPADGVGYNSAMSRLRFANKSQILGFSAERPSRLRGPQCHVAVGEEISSWERAHDAYNMLEFGLRLPWRWDDMPDPGPLRLVLSSTPKKNAITRELSKDPQIHITTENTYDNIENLDPAFAARLISKFEGTRLGQQEIYGIVLDDVEGAMWKSDWIRHVFGDENGFPTLEYVATRVGWDPAVTSTDKSDLHGIIGMGRLASDQHMDPWDVLDTRGPAVYRRKGDLVVMADRSSNMTPVAAARAAWALALEIGSPEVIIEDNQGKDTWFSVWKEAGGHESGVRLRMESASKSKEIRMIPLATLYEQSYNLGVAAPTHIWHMPGLEFLEEEQTSWVPAESSKSPNRIDALAWAGFGLGVKAAHSGSIQRAGRLSEMV